MTSFIDQIQHYPWFQRVASLPRTVLLAAAAGIAAVGVVGALWLQDTEYSALYTNIEAHDGGAIINALEQRHVPYRFANQGSTILVPSEQVYALRLQMAEQGLPRSGNAGFELLDEPKFGTSQFIEQVQYQRALEGELARSVEALQPVQSARVHLALPRQSLFIREQEQPTASVLVSLYPGRTLSKAQVAAIQRLVAASIPKLDPQAVSIIDQDGQLMSRMPGDSGLSSSQEEVRSGIEQRTLQRILGLLTPIVGSGNVRAEVNAQIDFTQHEQTSERYAPNEQPGTAAIRSKQTAHSLRTGLAPVQGIPGALSNQPPTSATATIQEGTQEASTEQALAREQSSLPSDQQNDATINYEVDRIITHTRQATGSLENLSVAVVVSYRAEDGTLYPPDSAQFQALEILTKRAMGYSETRGDTISIINSAFEPTNGSFAFWDEPIYQQMIWQAGKWLLWLIILIFLWRSLLRPIYKNVLETQFQPRMREAAQRQNLTYQQQADHQRSLQASRHVDNLKAATDLAQQDPRAVAMVLRTWLNSKNAK